MSAVLNQRGSKLADELYMLRSFLVPLLNSLPPLPLPYSLGMALPVTGTGTCSLAPSPLAWHLLAQAKALTHVLPRSAIMTREEFDGDKELATLWYKRVACGHSTPAHLKADPLRLLPYALLIIHEQKASAFTFPALTLHPHPSPFP
jgi:hypothetical protein